MKLEETGVSEEAEAVGYFPLDLKVGGVERLGLQWCCYGQAHERKNQIQEPQSHQITRPLTASAFGKARLPNCGGASGLALDWRALRTYLERSC